MCFAVQRCLEENEFVFVGWVPACRKHGINMVKRVSKFAADGSVGRIVYVCGIPQYHGGCSERLYPVDPVSHAPLVSTTSVLSQQRTNGLFIVFYFFYILQKKTVLLI